MSLQRFNEDVFEPELPPDLYTADEIESLIEELDPQHMYQRRPMTRRARAWWRSRGRH